MPTYIEAFVPTKNKDGLSLLQMTGYSYETDENNKQSLKISYIVKGQYLEEWKEYSIYFPCIGENFDELAITPTNSLGMLLQRLGYAFPIYECYESIDEEGNLQMMEDENGFCTLGVFKPEYTQDVEALLNNNIGVYFTAEMTTTDNTEWHIIVDSINQCTYQYTSPDYTQP